jgi:hypothetical protein
MFDMGNIAFSNPVRFMVSRRTVRQISDPEEALDYLRSYWPTEAGTRCQAAKQALAEAIQGVRSIVDARRAVVAALHEARLFVLI